MRGDHAYTWGWEQVLLVGIDWADKAHVYCLMDDAGTTLSTGTMEHTAEGLEQFMNIVRRGLKRRTMSWSRSRPRLARSSAPSSTRGSLSMPSIRKRWSAIGIGSGSPAPNRTCEMRGNWPRSCGLIALNIGP